MFLTSTDGKFASRRTDNRPTDFAAVVDSGCCGSGVQVLGSGFGFWQAPCTAACMAGLKRPEEFDVWKLGWELKRRGLGIVQKAMKFARVEAVVASLGEVRNQLLHAKDEGFVEDGDFREMTSLADRAIGAANALQKYLRSCPSKFEHRPRPRAKGANPEQST